SQKLTTPCRGATRRLGGQRRGAAQRKGQPAQAAFDPVMAEGRAHWTARAAVLEPGMQAGRRSDERGMRCCHLLQMGRGARDLLLARLAGTDPPAVEIKRMPCR